MFCRLILLLGCVGLVSVAAIAQQEAQPMRQPPVRTISVTSTAERMATPDVGLVVLAVQTQATTVAQAVAQNNTIANKVMDAVRGLTIRNLTLRTLGFDVQPVYEQPANNQPLNRPPRVVGYIITNRIEVRIPNANADRLSEDVGRVIDTALGAGANRVDNVSFTLENDQPVLEAALAEATKNTRATAMAMATAAGVQLGQLLTLSSTPSYTPPAPMYARAMDMAATGVPIVAGQINVQVTVSAVYEIR